MVSIILQTVVNTTLPTATVPPVESFGSLESSKGASQTTISDLKDGALPFCSFSSELLHFQASTGLLF